MVDTKSDDFATRSFFWLLSKVDKSLLKVCKGVLKVHKGVFGALF